MAYESTQDARKGADEEAITFTSVRGIASDTLAQCIEKWPKSAPPQVAGYVGVLMDMSTSMRQEGRDGWWKVRSA